MKNRRIYTELIARCLAIYSKVNPLDTLDIESLDSKLHAFSRVVSSMAVLCHEGDIERYSSLDPVIFSSNEEFKARFAELMTRACDSITQYAGQDAMNFSVKELMLALELTADIFPDNVVSVWREDLSAIEPNSSFYSHAERTTNRNVYIMGGEQLRQRHGLTYSESFIDSCWERQREHFNSRGMYLDNYDKDLRHNPVLYDLTTRVQLKLVGFGGYAGKYAEQINGVLRRGAQVSLLTQSSAFELPAGGRSNQFLFNEALLAADFEYEACYYSEDHDAATAGLFKQAARLAAETSLRWLKRGKHIKSFSSDPTVGTEGYGYYDKYMVTLSSFLAIAYLFADDGIDECDCPATLGGSFFCENENFHIITANVGPYSVEIITDPDRHYDSAGLCRLHKRGVPTELGLSTSFTKTPKYKLTPDVEAADLSIDLPKISALGAGAEVELLKKSSSAIEFGVTYHDLGVKEYYRLTSDGLDIEVLQDQPGIEFTVPLLSVGDGNTVIESDANSARVKYLGFIYEIHSSGNVTVPERLYSNRNGLYRAAHFTSASSTLSLNLTLKGKS